MKIEILIIDDSLEIGEALQIIMQNLGFACKYFDSAEKAMPYFQNELNPVIFLDIFMPNQNGLDLLPTIKKISPFTQVVMMTGESDIENVVASLKNKASDFLLKPFSMESVKVAVERGVEYYKLLKDNFNYQETLERDMKFISSIQKQVISPQKNSNTTYADFYAYSFVSGSFYYTEEIEGKTIIIFGDIEGNGVTSSFIGLLTISMLKDILRKETVPARVLSMLNDELYFRINIHTLTAVCLLIDPSLKQIHYANGGNTNPILVTDNVNEITYLNSEVSNIIGVMPGTEFITKSIPISENSILFLYNPGFLPSETNSKKEFETFVLNLQTIYNKTANFDSVKKEMDKYIKENLKNDSKKNLSFFLQKF
ncbi:MAG: response regulator [Leptospiraceae bacterium]|nr:response regulator [Leptospiraceae bacterium]